MTSNVSARVALTGALVTVVLAAFGIGMANEPPSPADAAAGKALLVLALCGAIVTTSAFLHFVSGASAARPRNWDAEGYLPE